MGFEDVEMSALVNFSMWWSSECSVYHFTKFSCPHIQILVVKFPPPPLLMQFGFPFTPAQTHPPYL